MLITTHSTRRDRVVRSFGIRAAVALSFVLSVVGCALFAPGAAHAAVRPLTIAAVGDSYASGEGAMGGAWLNAACHRSALAAPEDAARRLDSLAGFSSFACSGATTSSLLGPTGQLAMLPSGPIDALTISIGGNDLGFAGIVTSCMLPSDCTVLDSTVTAALAALPGRLAAVLGSVPGNVRHVFLTGYPDPTTGVFGTRCGSIWSPGFEGLEGISEAEADWASKRVVARLNATLAAAVAATNAAPGPHPVFHFVAAAPRFATHGYCTGVGSPAPWALPNPRFISTPLDSLTSQGDVMGTMHPNDLGQRAIGEALADAMQFLRDPGFEVAFEANTNNLWTVGSDDHGDWQLGMMAGTSPSITRLANGGYEVAFQANTGSLWTVGPDGATDWQLGMMVGTSPSIAALPNGGYEVAFEANTGNLWTVGSDNHGDWRLGMMVGTSPSIAALPNGGYEVAFQANTSNLWTVGSDGSGGDSHLGMNTLTSPAISRQ